MTDKMPETLYVVNVSEPVWLSVFRDTLTFGTLIATAVALNTLMPPSGWLNAALGICWFLWVLGRSIKLRAQKTPDEARQWLDDTFPKDTKQ